MEPGERTKPIDQREEARFVDVVTLFPHVGSASVYTRDGMGRLVVDNLVAFTQGDAPKTPVAETPFKGW